MELRLKICVVNTKGGVGKTTIAVHLAASLARVSETLLIDGDPQASAATWAAWRRQADRCPSPATVCLSGQSVFQEGKVLIRNFSYAVIDAGGRDSASLRSAFLLADKAVIPVGASNLDAAAMDDLLEIINVACELNTSLQAKVLLTRIDPRTKDLQEMIQYLDEKGFKRYGTLIYERVAYRRATGEGATVAEMARDTLAVKEIENLVAEVINEG